MSEPVENVHRSRKKMIVDNFIGGIAWALGSTVGFAIIIVVLGFFLTKIDFIPLIGGFLEDVISNALRRQNPFLN